MGCSWSRIIYDPKGRGLDIQDEAKSKYKIYRMTEWSVDEHGRQIATASVDLLGVGSPLELDVPAFYKWLREKELKGIDREGNVYDF